MSYEFRINHFDTPELAIDSLSYREPPDCLRARMRFDGEREVVYLEIWDGDDGEDSLQNIVLTADEAEALARFLLRCANSARTKEILKG